MRILLAEDDANIAVITEICLVKIGGHAVTTVADGDAAFAAACSESFDLVILDGMMPKRSGLQVARDLRKSGVDTPVIFLSAKSDSKSIAEFLAIGAGYIAKPFDPQTICASIDSILYQAGARSA